MHNVLIFGAGTSVHAGGPTMRDFIRTAEDVALTARGIDSAAFKDVFDGIAELDAVYAKAHLDSNNIEALLGAIDMGELLGRFGNRRLPEIQGLKRSIRTVIVQTLENSMVFPVDRSEMRAANEMQALAFLLRDIALHPTIRRETFSIITFNYDVLADVSLTHAKAPYHYGFADETKNGIALLKLHGSMNWGWCSQCQSVAVRRITRGTLGGFADGPNNFRVSMLERTHDGCGGAMAEPLLVPPTWDKAQYHGTIGEVWQSAAAELHRAERLYIVGYSLPESDLFFRYLFALGTAGPTRLNRPLK